MVKERSVLFGSAVRLSGVVSEAGEASPTRPACILLNAGVVHRVGPNRLYVRLARELASAGHVVMRFDFSGRGDSDVRTDGMSFLQSTVEEVRDAMNYLAESRGARSFILLGICSGAGNAFQAALADARVVGAVMIDVHAYPTFGYYLRHYARRIVSFRSWRNTLSAQNELGRKLRAVVTGGRGAQESQDARPAPVEPGTRPGDGLIPPKVEAEKAIRDVVGRGVRLLLIFSGTWRAFNYREQFHHAFPALSRLGMIDVEYFPDADHTFSRLYNQQRLVNTIRNWVTDHWRATERPAAPSASLPFQMPSV
jgi:hypothetical protein